MATESSAAPPRVEPSARPMRVAALEHNALGETHLVLVDVGKHLRHSLSISEIPERIGWSPDQEHILFVAGQELRMARFEEGKTTQVMGGIQTSSVTPFAFAPGAKTLAILSGKWVYFVPAGELPSTRGATRVDLPSGCDTVDLIWSTTDLVTLLCSSPGGAGRLVNISKSGGGAKTIPVSGLLRLLGSQPSGALVVVRSYKGSTQAGIIGETGDFQPWSEHPSTEATLPVAYFAPLGEVLLMSEIEDTGDPTHLWLVSYQAPAKPWLQHFSRLAELSRSSNDEWATFVDKARFGIDEMGGDIYVVKVGQESPEIVIRGNPGKVSYSAPSLP